MFNIQILIRTFIFVSLTLLLFVGLVSAQSSTITAFTPTETPTWEGCTEYMLDIENEVELYTEQQWLDDEELEQYLSEMNIDTINIPLDFGQPFLAIDWNATNHSADRGRMFVIGFEGLYEWGGHWGAGQIIYATYDFVVGTEYDTYADLRDYGALENKLIDIETVVWAENNILGYQVYKWYERFESIEKITVFPFAEYYVAIVYMLEGDYQEDYETTIPALYEDSYPEDEQCLLYLIDSLALSVEFNVEQFPVDEVSD